MIPRLGELKYKNLTSRQARVSGVVLIILGLFLAGLAAVIVGLVMDLIPLSTFFSNVYRDPEAEPTSVPIAAWLLILYIALFGLVSVPAGIWQVWFGERNRHLTRVIVVMGLVLAAFGIIAEALD